MVSNYMPHRFELMVEAGGQNIHSTTLLWYFHQLKAAIKTVALTWDKSPRRCWMCEYCVVRLNDDSEGLVQIIQGSAWWRQMVKNSWKTQWIGVLFSFSPSLLFSLDPIQYCVQRFPRFIVQSTKVMPLLISKSNVKLMDGRFSHKP